MTHNKIDMAICLLLALLAIGCATPMATLNYQVTFLTNTHPATPKNERDLSNIDSISYYHYTKPHKLKTATLTLETAKYNKQGAILRKNRETTVSKPYYTRSHNSHEENYFDNQGRLVRHENMRDDTLFMVQTFAYNKRGQLVETTKQYQPTKYFIAEKWCYSYDRHGNERSSEFYQNGELTHRSHTRHNRKGQPLTEALYRGDGVLLDSTIYTYNRNGDLIEERSILEHDRNELRGIIWETWDEVENHSQQRHLWQKSHARNLGWSPIQYDTIGTRYTYHSKGKQALKQVWWSEWGEWRDKELTIYDSDGGVAEKWKYYTYDHIGEPYSYTTYNSQGLPTSWYERHKDCDTLSLKRRDEYNEQGVLIRKTEYDTFYSKELREVYNDRGDLIERWQMLSDGTLSLTTKYNYEYVDSEGKCVATKRNGKRVLPHPVSVTTTEIERLADGGTSEILTEYAYDNSGNVAGVLIHQSVDSPTYILSWARYYEGEMTDENLFAERREEFFFRPEE